jgi:hypothetical protein
MSTLRTKAATIPDAFVLRTGQALPAHMTDRRDVKRCSFERDEVVFAEGQASTQFYKWYRARCVL